MSKELTPIQQKALSLKDHLSNPKVIKQIDDALPSFLDAKRFLRVVYTQVLKNPKLLDCTRESFLSAMIQAAELGLEPTLGKAALIPYRNKGVMEVQFQPMYRGLIELARRTGKIKVTAHNVYEKDEFSFSYGLHEDLTHIPHMGEDRGNIIGSYTCWTDQETGLQSFLFMPISEIYKIRDRSSGWQAHLQYKSSTPWITDEGEMCKKTVIKRHAKLQPSSVEMEQAVDNDSRIEAGLPPKWVGPEEELFSLTEKGQDVQAQETNAEELERAYQEDIVSKTKVPKEKIDEYISITAKESDMEPEDVKIQAIENAESFLKYVEKWAEENQGQPELFQCPYCSFNTKSERGLKKHISQSHKDRTEDQGTGTGEGKSAWSDDDFWKRQIMPWEEELGLPIFNRVLARFDAKTVEEVPVERRDECWKAMSEEGDKKAN